VGCEYLYVEARGPRRTRTVAQSKKKPYIRPSRHYNIPTRYVTSTHSLYCTVLQIREASGRIFNPPKLRCCDGFPIRYHPIGKLLVDSFLGGPHGTPVVYPDDGSAPLARGFSI